MKLNLAKYCKPNHHKLAEIVARTKQRRAEREAKQAK